MLIRIVAPHFVAGVEAILTEEGWVVTKTAPILKYMKRWSANTVFGYSTKKGWEYQRI